MLKLKEASCRWSLTHLFKEGDTDLFPKPFEIEAFEAFPDEVLKLLQNIDIGAYTWFEGRSTVVPKDILSFRSATQLNPLDSLVLTALIKQFGPKIEKKRIPAQEDIVFSYRFEPNNKGQMYSSQIGWPLFWYKSMEKAHITGGWVAMADISSYYNQIYHHAIENELLSAGLPEEAVRSIIRLFANLTQGVSRGIPVGPHAVHLIAECTFDPIDRSMLSRGYNFSRFVDDIHIFCKTEDEAKIALYDLATILDKQQKLSMQRHKVRIVPFEQFIEQANQVLSEAPLTPLEKNVIEVIDKHSNGNRYQRVRFSELSEDELRILSQDNLETLLKAYLGQDEPNFVRIRWLFRRLAQVGAPGAIPMTITHADQLSPAMADLGSYLLSVRYNFSGNWQEIGDGILRALRFPVVQHSEYLMVTLLDLFARLPVLDHTENILQMYNSTGSQMVKRKIIRVATTHKATYWLREQKESLFNVDPWLKRAIIASASVFSKDERKYWLRRVEREGNELEKLVARWARTNE